MACNAWLWFRRLVLLFSLAVSAGCQTPPPSHGDPLPTPRGALSEYPWFVDQPTGVAVSAQGRIFVSFPRWGKNPRYSVAEVMTDGSLAPFPDSSWNRWGDDRGSVGTHFVCVQSVYVDGDDNLWILDPASPSFAGVVAGGAKLVRVNLKNNRVEQVIPYDDNVAPPKSYLNDVRIDTANKVAYLTDSGTGAIIATDMANGTSRRLLAGDASTRAEEGYVPVIDGRPLRGEDGKPPQIHADGIALDAKGEYLYYQPLVGKSLYRIRTDHLRDPTLSTARIAGKVERIMATGAVDGMLMDRHDNLYLTSLEDKAIKRVSPGGEVAIIVQDDRIQWPDSMSISEGYLYFTDSQINRMPRFNGGSDRRVLPYTLYKVLLPLP